MTDSPLSQDRYPAESSIEPRYPGASHTNGQSEAVQSEFSLQALDAMTLPHREVIYSICTLVTRPGEYGEMIASFRDKGFDTPASEFLYVDNSNGNRLDAYAAYNHFLNVSRGAYVIPLPSGHSSSGGRPRATRQHHRRHEC